MTIPLLHIRLLGEFSLVYGDIPMVGVNFARVHSLLAYLVLHRHAPQSRQQIAFLFWPDSSEAQARANLRQRLHYLHQALPEADRFLQLTSKTIQWRADAPFIADVVEFEHQLALARAAEQTTHTVALRTALAAAVACYQGDLLPDCYDDWILPLREQLQEQLLKALERLIQLCEEQRAYAAAIDYGRCLLRHDPLHEPTYRGLMRLHVLNGDRASALRVYHTCATVLARELDVTPNHDTQIAYERLLNLDGAPALPVVRSFTAAGARLTGRQAEWRRLQTAWRSAVQGRVHFVLVAGEAGIGKSRLAEEMLLWASQQGIHTAHTRAYAAAGGLAYAPVIEWLRTDLLHQVLAHLDPVWLTEIARLRPELLVEQPDLPRPEPLIERWQRQRLSEALARTFLAAATPLLLVIDDLQWCDPETLEWLYYLLRADPQARLLVIGTVRPEEVERDHPLTALLLNLRRTDWLTEITLGPLDAQETALLAAQVADHELNAETAQCIYRETEGNPLFVVEMVRAKPDDWCAEPGDAVNDACIAHRPTLPTKVQAVIQARLAQLSAPARELVNLAAVIGRFFTFAVLAQASGVAEDVLVRGLDELWQRRLVREQGVVAYDFSHDRIREIAYAEISPAQRRILHRRVAQALESVHAANLDPVSGQLAAHYEHAALLEQAILYHRRAGDVAYRLYANEEAINHWTKALDLLKILPVSSECIQQELDVLFALGPALIAARDYIALEVARVYHQAQALCRQVGDTARLFIALWGLALSYGARGNVQAARDLAGQCLRLAQDREDPMLLVAAHAKLGEDLYYLGEFPLAKAHLEQAISYYDPQQHDSLSHIFGGQDPVINNLGPLSHCLWFLGYIDSGLQRSQEVFARGQQVVDPFNRALASACSGVHHALRQDWKVALAHNEVAIAIATQWSIPALLVWPLNGWALAKQERITEGIALMQQSLVEVHVFTPMLRAALAEAYGRVGRVDEGLVLIDETLALVQRTGMVYWNAELHRLQGELLMAQGADKQAVEVCYGQAIQIARQQNAKSLELRATVSLARLWQKQGRQTEARERLADIYAWFTEGFTTLDLQEAQALLAALS